MLTNPFWRPPSPSKHGIDDCKKELGRHSDKLNEFNRKFGDEKVCKEYLFNKRWPNGFRCPRCHHKRFYKHENRDLYQCKNKACKHQCSITSGTIFNKSRKPLVTWFKMIFLVVQKKRLTTKKLQQFLKIKTYKTVWQMKDKIKETAFQKDAYKKFYGLVSEKDLRNFLKKNKSKKMPKKKSNLKKLISKCNIDKMVKQLSSK